jgi:NADH-quinone oxidoreductase subunit E
MSVRRLAADQPEGFAFTPENLEWAKAQIRKYPDGKQASAVLALLWRAQEQMGGWLPEPALRSIADMLGMAYIRVYEIATFYSMFNLAPVGRYYVQVCGTTPCWLRGANEIKDTCRRVIGEPNHVTPDGLFSWTEVECLAACVNAPMAQINKDYYEDLTPESLESILADLKAGRPVTPGPQNGRQASAPLGGPITLTDAALYRDEEPGDMTGPPLTDDMAKKPTDAASQRERAVPKPPLGKSRKPRPS